MPDFVLFNILHDLLQKVHRFVHDHYKINLVVIIWDIRHVYIILQD